MANIVLVVIICVALIAAIYSIIKSNKNGSHCHGCPNKGCCDKDSKERGACR